ncbi:MAG: ferrochelatase [bacterium]
MSTNPGPATHSESTGQPGRPSAGSTAPGSGRPGGPPPGGSPFGGRPAVAAEPETFVEVRTKSRSPYDCVFLMAYGAPECMADVRPFLDNVLRGLPVPKERYEAVVHHYELIGGRSPLNELTDRQAAGLRAELKNQAIDLPVFVGMRFYKPYMFTALRAMKDAGCRRAIGIILSPYQSMPSWEKYMETIQEILDLGYADEVPAIDFIKPWFDHPLFARSQAAQVQAALDQIPAERRQKARIIFTAHSIPTAVAARCPYVSQIEHACKAVAEELGRTDWILVWQSRSGDPKTPWLEPDVNEYLSTVKEKDGVEDVVLCPIGFISDHVEVMYDLDLEAKETCRHAGIGMVRAETVNDHPVFIKALADIVKTRMAKDRATQAKTRM